MSRDLSTAGFTEDLLSGIPKWFSVSSRALSFFLLRSQWYDLEGKLENPLHDS